MPLAMSFATMSLGASVSPQTSKKAVPVLGFGLGGRVWGLGFRAQGLGLRVRSLGFGFAAYGLGSKEVLGIYADL